jgi:hypothetical protein
MVDEIETIDSPKDEPEVVAETPKEEEEPKYTDAERKAFARAKVAEAKVKELKAQLETKEPQKKSEGLDYGQKAFLLGNGIKGEKEIKFVEKELKASGKSLEELLENNYFKTGLEDLRAIAKTDEAVISGKRSGGSATDSVEYWMTKPIEEVPKEMRIKVVNAKLAKDSEKGMFYDK